MGYDDYIELHERDSSKHRHTKSDGSQVFFHLFFFLRSTFWNASSLDIITGQTGPFRWPENTFDSRRTHNSTPDWSVKVRVLAKNSALSRFGAGVILIQLFFSRRWSGEQKTGRERPWCFQIAHKKWTISSETLPIRPKKSKQKKIDSLGGISSDYRFPCDLGALFSTRRWLTAVKRAWTWVPPPPPQDNASSLAATLTIINQSGAEFCLSLKYLSNTENIPSSNPISLTYSDTIHTYTHSIRK